MVLRYATGVVLGAIVTFGLLMLMRAFIANPSAATEAGIKGSVVDFVRVQEDQEVIVTKRKLKPPPPDEPPPPMPALPYDPIIGDGGYTIGDPEITVDPDPSNTGGFSSDGEYLPIVKVQPIYPRRAQTRGIEGHVLLQFTVTASGAVRDPVVVESKPPGIFDRAAINAALKFKYKPKMVGGEPIEVAGVLNLIKFELDDD